MLFQLDTEFDWKMSNFLSENDFTVSKWLKVYPSKLDSGCLDVWRVYLPAIEFEDIESLLSIDERSRAAKYRFAKDRNSYAVSRAALRLILGRYVQESPRNLSFSSNAFGKPSLVGDFGNPIFFNVSHSAEFTLIAVGSCPEIGIDIEYVRELDYLSLAESVFSHREQSVLKELSADRQKHAFYTFWTRKEAFIKAIGYGLSFPLKEFDVALFLGKERHITIHSTQKAFDTGWEIFDIQTEAQYCAALVVPSKAFERIRAFDFKL
ncbi:4'-phosphopantetheinyl transferase superfamily protein [Planktothrix sp. FACHB-1355]|nr:4'-phosphopantetheinyl transferase superfamily protein [Planktothrix sp. FACHB-1355]